MSTEATTPYESTHELPVGYRLEEFEIKSVLGSGGFGITYLATDVDLKRDVVVKENLPFQCALRDNTHSVRPRTSSFSDRDQFQWALQSFMREAETLSRFDHPNIVRVLRRFEANNTAYFVMPYVPGASLKEVIDQQVGQNEAFVEARLKELLYPLLDALEVLHREGVYHRDIKAANILLATGHRPILIDFGAARLFISEKSHTVVESAGYTPFEQLQSRGNVGPWSDIYALGGTFYTAIHGQPPPRASDRMRNDPIVKLADEYGSVYSASFLQAIDWALAVDERERPQSVAEWRAALQSTTAPARMAAAPTEEKPKVQASRPPALTTPEEPRQLVPNFRDKLPDVNALVDKARAGMPDLGGLAQSAAEKGRKLPFGLIGKIAGGLAGVVLLGVIGWHVVHPFFMTPGSVTIAATPTTAMVHISGQTDQAVPAQFPKLKVGTYSVTISAPGYDPVTRSIDIQEGQAYSWIPVDLQRALGTLNLTGVPPHARFELVSKTDPDGASFHGMLPATFTDIPSGDYKLKLSAGDMDIPETTVHVDPHTTTNSTVDAVKVSVSQGADPAVAAAILGQTKPSDLSGADREAYAKLSNEIIGRYVRYNMFPAAQALIDAEKELGIDVTTLQKSLDDSKTAYIKDNEDAIRSLITDGKLDAAKSRIDAASSNLAPDDANALAAEFQPQLAAYQQEESQAMQAASGGGDPAQAYTQLNAFVQKYPANVAAQLALANLSTQIAPDHDRLSREVATLRSVPSSDISADESAKLQAAQSHLQNELDTYDKLKSALRSSTGDSGEMDRLNAAIKVHEANIERLSLIPSVSYGPIHFDPAAGDRRALDRDQTRLKTLQDDQKTNQGAADSAKQNFATFCKTVPW
jgi:serine/threonine protein kinase